MVVPPVLHHEREGPVGQPAAEEELVEAHARVAETLVPLACELAHAGDRAQSALTREYLL